VELAVMAAQAAILAAQVFLVIIASQQIKLLAVLVALMAAAVVAVTELLVALVVEVRCELCGPALLAHILLLAPGINNVFVYLH
jgi:hypothetical protein